MLLIVTILIGLRVYQGGKVMVINKSASRGKKAIAVIASLALLVGVAYHIVAYSSGATDQIVSGSGRAADAGSAKAAQTFYWDANAQQVTNSPTLVGTSPNSIVSTKQSVSDLDADGNALGENEFIVTIEVETSFNVEEVDFSHDAAVVLVLDISGSMAFPDNESAFGFRMLQFTDRYPVPLDPDTMDPLPESTVYPGEYEYLGETFAVYNGSGTELDGVWMQRDYNTGTGWPSFVNEVYGLSIPKAHSRMGHAIEAAKEFLEIFAQDSGSSKRMVSIVTFGRNAELVSNMGNIWTDISIPANLQSLSQTIDSINASSYNYIKYGVDSYGTFMQGGLMLARNLFGSADSGVYATAPRNADGNAIGNRFVILLTDGEPNNRRSMGGQPDVGYNNNENMNITLIQRNEITPTVEICREATALVADQLRIGSQSGYYNALLYTVAYNMTDTKVNNLSAVEWLAQSVAFDAGSAFSSDTQAALADDLRSIAAKTTELIKYRAQAWTVSVPMGNYIVFDEPIGAGGVVAGASYASYSSNTLSLDLTAMTPVVTGTPGTETYIYTYSYKVKLDTTANGFPSNTALPTNGATTLKYVIVDALGLLTAEPNLISFMSPQVMGRTLSAPPTTPPTTPPSTPPSTPPGGGGGGGGGGGIQPPRETEIVDEDPPLVELDTENHFAYMIGYSDGTARPNSNITRAEASTIFFRLLSQVSRAALWSTGNEYPDVAGGVWYNNAISTLTRGAVLTGYEDGSFKPDATITRAELATVAVRFDVGGAYLAASTATDVFSDISGHWAERYIVKASELGYVNGYSDGTFKPNAPITRAEMAQLLNNVLDRFVESEADMLDGMKTFSDNRVGAWYYFTIQEATNSHYFTRKTDSSFEVWTELRDNPDWPALEKPNSKPGDVVYDTID